MVVLTATTELPIGGTWIDGGEILTHRADTRWTAPQIGYRPKDDPGTHRSGRQQLFWAGFPIVGSGEQRPPMGISDSSQRWWGSAFTLAGFVLAVVTLPASVALAGELDQAFCEVDLSGTWDSASDSCSVSWSTNLNGAVITVPAGFTLIAQIDPNTSKPYPPPSITVASGGSLSMYSATEIDLPETVRTAPLWNNGSVELFATSLEMGAGSVNNGSILGAGSQLPFHFSSVTLYSSENKGLIIAPIVSLVDSVNAGSIEADSVYAYGTVVNYGSVAADALALETVDGIATWFNYCGASLTAAEVDAPDRVVDVGCPSIATTITPTPASGAVPLTVDWTITLENDGDQDLTSPSVEVSADGGATTPIGLSGPSASGDTGEDGVLGVGEVWKWVIQTKESTSRTLTATGSGTASSGFVVTYPGDPEARSRASLDFFVDVDSASLFVGDIQWLRQRGITKGCNPPVNDRFCPDQAVTRAQMASFLVRALDLRDGADLDRFVDDDESVHEADINQLAAAGITRGCNPPDNDRFCPHDPVTRGEMAAFLVRAYGYTDGGGGNIFTDDDDSIFEGDIDRLGTAGVTKGCNPPTNDRFCPEDPVLRDQMASFLARAHTITD